MKRCDSSPPFDSTLANRQFRYERTKMNLCSYIQTSWSEALSISADSLLTHTLLSLCLVALCVEREDNPAATSLRKFSQSFEELLCFKTWISLEIEERSKSSIVTKDFPKRTSLSSAISFTVCVRTSAWICLFNWKHLEDNTNSVSQRHFHNSNVCFFCLTGSYINILNYLLAIIMIIWVWTPKARSISSPVLLKMLWD